MNPPETASNAPDPPTTLDPNGRRHRAGPRRRSHRGRILLEALGVDLDNESLARTPSGWPPPWPN